MIVAGVDVATAAVRVTCADARGTILARGAAGLPPPVRAAPGHSEQDARAWWPAAGRALREAMAALGPRGRDVVAVSIASTSGTVVLADSAGDPVSPALMYDDRRAQTEAEVADDAGRARWSSLGLRVTASFALPKLAWLVRRSHAAARACSTADLLAWRLTGQPPPADWSHALKLGYDVLRGEWPAEVLAALGIDPAVLPPVAAPGTPAGRVGAPAAAATGLPEGCEVRLGMTDGCAAQLAAGAGRPGRAVSVLGTTMVIKAASTRLLSDPAGAVYSHRHPGGWWLPGGASNVGAAILRERFPGADLAELDAAAEARGPASCVIYPLRGEGERFPFFEPTARGFALGAAQDRVDEYRALLEGVAFVERIALDRLEALGLHRVGELRVAGGAARSRVWNTIRATVSDRPVLVTREATSAFGACLLAAAGVLHEDLDAAATAMVSVQDRAEPDPAQRQRLHESRARLELELHRRGWIADGDPTAQGSMRRVRIRGHLRHGRKPSA